MFPSLFRRGLILLARAEAPLSGDYLMASWLAQKAICMSEAQGRDMQVRVWIRRADTPEITTLSNGISEDNVPREYLGLERCMCGEGLGTNGTGCC